MELNEAVASVAKRLGVPLEQISSAISQYIDSLKKRRNPATRAHGYLKLDPSRNVKLEEDVLWLGKLQEKIPVITLTPSVRLGLYIMPGGESENKKVAVRFMRRNENEPGLYNSDALSRGEFNALNRTGWKNAPERSPGLVKLNPR
jgi:hypothetical protein